MQKTFEILKNNFIKGLIFLVPFLVVLVLVTKVLGFLTGFSKKIASLFGIPSILGISGHTIIGVLLFILVCIVLGRLVRYKGMNRFNNWVDSKLAELLPGYEAYREMALNKINRVEEKLPFQSVIMVKEGRNTTPAFLVEEMGNGQCCILLPKAGNAKEGKIVVMNLSDIELLPDADIRKVFNAINKLGIGLENALKS